MSTQASFTFEPLIFIVMSYKCWLWWIRRWWIRAIANVFQVWCGSVFGTKYLFNVLTPTTMWGWWARRLSISSICQSNIKVQLHKILHVCHCDTINIATFLARLRPLFLVVFWLDSHTFNTYIHTFNLVIFLWKKILPDNWKILWG